MLFNFFLGAFHYSCSERLVEKSLASGPDIVYARDLSVYAIRETRYTISKLRVHMQFANFWPKPDHNLIHNPNPKPNPTTNRWP